MFIRTFSMLAASFAVGVLVMTTGGCSSEPKPPTPAQAAAAAQQADQTQQQQIQQNPNLSDAQKANSLAIVNRPNGMADRVHSPGADKR